MRFLPFCLAMFFAAFLSAVLFPAAVLAQENEGLEWQSGERTYLTGKHVSVSGKVDRSLTAIGDDIVIGNDAVVDGDALLVGRTAIIDGRVSGNLEARAARVLINGPIDGDVSIWADELELAADAEIGGDFSFFVTSEPEIDRDALIAGEISAHILDGPIADEGDEAGARKRGFGRLFELTFTSALFLAFLAAILGLFAPGWTSAVQDAGREAPVQAIAYGVGWLIGVPVLALFAALTVVGVPLALLMLLLYVAGLALGMVMSIHLVGAALVGAFNIDLGSQRRLLAVALGALVLWAVAGLPFVGGVLWFAAVCAGIGAVLMSGRSRYLL